MQISNDARDYLNTVLKENNANGIRVVFAGVS